LVQKGVCRKWRGANVKIAIGNDHAGYELKSAIRKHLEQKGVEVVDFGTNDKKRTDYPIYAKRACYAVINGQCDRGILICGTGVGMSLTANKIPGIRAVVCSEPCSAVLSRQHNNTNVLCFGARVVGIELAKMIVDLWLKAEFEGGRHQKRIDMITELEKAKTEEELQSLCK
jgi:ribose 5-phosphate isomerase B